VRNVFTAAAAAGFASLDGAAGSARLAARFWSAYDRCIADVAAANDAVAQQAFATL
jgi:hypothetical protein